MAWVLGQFSDTAGAVWIARPLLWPTLLRRMFSREVLVCARGGGPARPPRGDRAHAVRRLLAALGLAAELPRSARLGCLTCRTAPPHGAVRPACSPTRRGEVGGPPRPLPDALAGPASAALAFGCRPFTFAERIRPLGERESGTGVAVLHSFGI